VCVLVRHPPEAAGDLIADLARGAARIEERTMARALLDDGQEVLALNEIFVGHVTHQSARYTIALGDRSERQSSSGVIAATGTGATGWAASINRQLASPLALPKPVDPELALFVREAWPSSVTGTTLTAGRITASSRLTITCELGEGGTVFGDGIEADHVAVDWGQRIEIGAASRTLRLVA
jgi:DNA helicase HerA-like ATPase